MNDFASPGTAERGWLGIGPRKSILSLDTTDLYPVLGVELHPTQRLGPTMFRPGRLAEDRKLREQAKPRARSEFDDRNTTDE
jgi:hypothetical protein